MRKGWGINGTHCLSTKTGNCSTQLSVQTCLWVSLTGSELRRVEADGFNGPCDDFISLSVSKDRESLTGGLHWTESMLWFKDLFFYTVGVLETTVMSV